MEGSRSHLPLHPLCCGCSFSVTAGMDHLQDVLKELGCSLQLVESLEGQKHLRRIYDIKTHIMVQWTWVLKIQQPVNYYKWWLGNSWIKQIAVSINPVKSLTGAPAASMVLLTPSLAKESFTTLTKGRQLKEGSQGGSWNGQIGSQILKRASS